MKWAVAGSGRVQIVADKYSASAAAVWADKAVYHLDTYNLIYLRETESSPDTTGSLTIVTSIRWLMRDRWRACHGPIRR